MTPDLPWYFGTYREIVEKVRAGSGPAAGDRAQGMWMQAMDVLGQCDKVIGTAVAGTGEAWSGPAAESFRAAMGPVSSWVNGAVDDAVTTTDTVVAQGHAAGELRRLLPPEPHGVNPFGGGLLYKAVMEDAQRLAVGYAGQTASNRRKLDLWSFPPGVTVDVPAPGSAARVAVAGADPSGTGGPAPTPRDPGSAAGAVAGFVPAAGAVPPGAAGSRPGDTTGAAGGVGGAPGAGGVGPGGAAAGGTGSGGGVPGGTGFGGDGRGTGGGTGLRGGPGAGPGSGGGASTTRGTPGGGTGFGGEGGTAFGGREGGAGGDGALGVPGRGSPGPGGVPDAVPHGRGGAGDSSRVVGGFGGVDALPPGTGGRGLRPPSPGALPPAAPTWRDLVAAQPPVEQPGARGGPGALYPPPMVGGTGGSSERAHRRARFLVDDSGLFTDDRWFPPAVIGPEP